MFLLTTKASPVLVPFKIGSGLWAARTMMYALSTVYAKQHSEITVVDFDDIHINIMQINALAIPPSVTAMIKQ